MSGSLLAAQLCLRDAWPGLETFDVGGWRLRASRGGYNRANSVWPGAFDGTLSLDAAIDRAEAFYRSRGFVPRFQMLGIAVPAGLDAALAIRGYRRETDCSDLEKAVLPVAMPPEASLSEDVTDEWSAVYAPAQPPEKRAEYPAIAASLTHPHAFIVARYGGAPAAVGLVTRVGTDAAVDCVMTRADARRAGAATVVMTAAEAWASGEGARRLLLSVVDDNAPAVRLYARLGYRRLSGYHYRVAA